MHPVAAIAEGALRSHVHPALRLCELLDLVAPRVDRTLDRTRLRAILETYPDRFRLLDPGCGPWRNVVDAPDGAGIGFDTWVLLASEATDPPPGTRATLKLRESVRWLGRGIDPRSPRQVSRWYALALAERAVRAAIARRAA